MKIDPGPVMEVEKINFRKLFRDIRLHVDVGLKLYRAKRSEKDATFYEIFEKLDSAVEQSQEHQEYILQNVSKYDFINPNGVAVKASGYRGVLHMMSYILQPLLHSLQKAAKDRSSFRFPASEHINTLSVYCSALQGVERFAFHSKQLMEATPAPRLFNNGEICWKVIRASIVEYVSRDIFYGKLFGIQYSPNVKSVLKMMAVGMASYEQWYHATKDEPVKQLLTSLWKGSRYLKNPTRLGLKMDSVTADCSVHFVKAFWSLSEHGTFQSAVKMVSQSVEIYHWMEVPAKELTVKGRDGKDVEVKPPSVHVGYKPIPLLLISYKWRGSQPYGRATKKTPSPLSPALVVHLHGGGYVAQSPQSHAFYLRKWAFELDVPIVSIDYSLSPEAPYPRALEEVVLAYCWILQNLESLGTTGERIMFVGDSSGGNLALTASMKLKEMGVRLPDALLIVYPSTNVSTAACPSRIISMVDPILPLGVLVACQQAYCNQLPTPEELKSCRECRSKIMRSQGYYIPDSETGSYTPKSKKRFSIRSRTKSASASSSKEGSTKPKIPPPRPPPPSGSVSKAQLEAVSSLDQSKEPTLELKEPTLETKEPILEFGGMMDVPLTSLEAHNGSDAAEGEEFQTKFPVCVKQEPHEGDKLTPAEFEDLVEEILKNFKDGDATKDPFMSPLLAPDEMLSGLPPVHIVGAALDSVLDDAVSMAHRLQAVQQPVTLDVIENLPHGFLAIVTAANNSDMNTATKICLDYMQEELHIHQVDRAKK